MVSTADGRRASLYIAGVAGAVWGLLGYALLWGFTPVVVHPTFVHGFLGTLLLLPVRVVLWAIHGMERVAGRSFDFSDNHWWIGLAAAAVGALIVMMVVWAVMRPARAVGGSGGQEIAEPRERL